MEGTLSGTSMIPGSTLGRRRGAAIAVGFVVVAVVGGILITGTPGVPVPSSSGNPGASQAVTSAVPGAGTPSLEPSQPPDGSWAGVDLPPLAPIADLQPVRADAAGIRLDTAFTLTSLSGTDAQTLAARLQTDPEISLVVSSGSTPASATVRPVRPLTEGRTYRFTLHAEDGSLAGSWAFQSRAPLHIVNTLPGDQTTEVPIDTGIEVTFDQDGAADMARFFSISPAVKGRFERHDRTQVFVPTGLRRATLYTVTIRHGVPIQGTDLSLERDVRFRFETAATTASPPYPRIYMGRDVLESSPTDRPVLGLQVIMPDEGDGPTVKPPAKADVRVYKLPSIESTIDRLRAFLDAPSWTEWSRPMVPTTGLPRVMSFKAALRALPTTADHVIVFPTRLPRGLYLVEVGAAGRKVQAFLQVTEVSAWVSVLSDRTVVWVNDVARGRPIDRAAVLVADGSSLGRTGSNGLLVTSTPNDLVPSSSSSSATAPTAATSPILIIRAPNGHSVLLPFDTDRSGGLYRGEWSKEGPAQGGSWWSLLSTDRSVYRRDDRVQAWGLLRRRIDGRVPTTVDLRLIRPENQDQGDPAAVVRVTARPTASGAYAASVKLDGAALGGYVLEALVDGQVVSRTWLDVGIIRKPAYRLSVTTDRHVIIAGQTVEVTTEASFFDGQPVPATQFSSGVDPEDPTTMTATEPTGADGKTTSVWKPTASEYGQGSDWSTVTVQATRPEEGEISSDASVLVFPNALNLDADGTISGRRLIVTGAVHDVDFARLERELAGSGEPYREVEPNGRPAAGVALTATITEYIPVRRLVGYDYDPISKRVVPRYDVETREKALRTDSATTKADGSFRLAVRVPNPAHDYGIELAFADSAGRRDRRTLTASRPLAALLDDSPRFETVAGPREGDLTYRVGEQVRLTMTDGSRPLPSGGSNRYLYIVARQGLRSATVTTGPRLSHRFVDGDTPGIFIIGVRFTGHGYAAKADTWADFDVRQRRIDVTMTADRSSYRPGDAATVTVRTTGLNGRPIPSTVTLRAVDEKLFAMGIAQEVDPLSDLYVRVESGIVRLTATHQLPTGNSAEGEGGAAGGGGDDGGQARDDFRDTLFFRQLETDADGRATVAIQLSDDLTSWHLSASAVTGSLRAGEGQLMLPVGLPFFVEATIADEYLASDRPVIRLRGFGSALHAGDPVVFTVSSTSLGLASTEVRGVAFKDVSVPLPALTVGRQTITVGGVATVTGGVSREDRLVRTFEVVRSRSTTASVASATVTADLRAPGGPDLTTYTFSDAGRGRFVALLQTLANEEGARVDQALARAIARDILISEFGVDPASLPPAAFDPGAYPVGSQEDEEGLTLAAGIPLVPYGGPDAALAARIALLAPDRFDKSALRDTLIWIRDLPTTTRELRLAILTGLAELGEPVLADLRVAARATDLTIRERISLALGFQAVGDDASALAIERALLTRYGERLGTWTRLRVGTDLDDTVAATADLALVAAGIGDPIGPSLAAYVDANPAHDTLHVLDQVGYIERTLARTPAAAASFSYTVGGRRSVVDLQPGDAFTIVLTAGQREGLRLEPLGGQVAMSASWTQPTEAGSLKLDPALKLKRTVTPAGSIPTDRLVVVDLTPTFGAFAVHGCYQVVDLVPSGLAPVSRTDSWVGDDGTMAPYDIVGQRVEFCASNDPKATRVTKLRYLARVVTPGVYTWEPAVIQLTGAPEAVGFTGMSRLTISDR
jgi:hypothetical protein